MNCVMVQRTLKKTDYSEEEMTPVGTSTDLISSTQPYTAPTIIISLKLGVSSRPGWPSTPSPPPAFPSQVLGLQGMPPHLASPTLGICCQVF